MGEENEWEWDKERLATVGLILVIIVGMGYIVVANMPANIDRNVTYTLIMERDATRIDLVYRTFFGTPIIIANASLVTAKLQIADVPDVTRLVISVLTTPPMRLVAIVISEYPAESNVLHGQNQVPMDQTSYVVTLDVGQRNLIAYMFFENVYGGSFEFAASSFKIG